MNSGLASLARAELLDLPERDAAAESDVVGAVLRWLRDNPRCLLILDNADTREALLAVTHLLPALAGGRVLITSRRRDWPPGVHRHPIDLIPLDAARELLLQRTAQDRRRERDDDAQALRLAELLDGLPLALEQAAAYIAHTQISLAEYLDVWESECDSVLGWYDEGIMQYPAPLAITWQRTFRQLAPTAQALLRLIAHLAPDPIPVDMLESGAEVLREAAQRFGPGSDPELKPRPVRNDIAELAALSLVTRQGATLMVHRMVQEVIRQRIPEESRTAWTEMTLALVARYAPIQSDDASTWPAWDLLRPHVAQLLAHAVEQGLLENAAASGLMTGLGMLLLTKSLPVEAEPLMRKALEIDQKIFDPDSLEVAKCLHNLGVLLKTTGRIEEAEPLLRSAVAIFFERDREWHPDASKPLNALALVLVEGQRWKEAEDLLRKALALDQEAYAIARDLHNLAFLLTAMGRISEAEPVIRRSLEISREVNGKTHPKTARKMQILAGVLRDLGRTDEAEPLARQALEVFEQVLGPDHPLTRSARKDLSSLTPA